MQKYRIRNVAWQQDPDYIARVPEGTRKVHEKISELKASNKMLEGGVELAEATIGTASMLLGGVEGTLESGIVKVAAKGGVQATESVITGFGKHSVNRAIERGFKTPDILKL